MPHQTSDILHDSARGHVTGKSIFIDDMPPLHRELLVDYLGSPVAHGTLRSIDLSAAQNIPGVVALLTAKDILARGGHNHFGPVVKDEHLLVEEGKSCVYIGDPIVLIAAENKKALDLAKKAIKLAIDPLPPIFSIDDAIAADSFLNQPSTITTGDIDSAFAAANANNSHTLESTLTIGGQDHFYLESHAAIAIPGEDGAMQIHSSTQHTSEVQALVAEIIGVPFNHVVCTCKRMGGGFGGKETQAAQPAAMVALVAAITNRPARIIYTKDDDMKFTGKRHPFKAFYKVAFTSDGLLQALDVQLYSNGGCTLDLSAAVLERALFHSDNAYFLPNARIMGRVCKTNLPSNTAFRGFGGPQGVAMIENIMQEIAAHLNLDAYDIRERNLYGIDKNNVTPYGQPFRNNILHELLAQLRTESNYNQRRAEINKFNANSKTHLKGLAMTPVKFGISFTHKTLNQANALVNIYTDGTVLVATGATEMGQGVYTRIRKLVADDFGISFDRVLIAATSTDKSNNTSPSAASATTDLNGAAALDATTKIKSRLAEFAAPLLNPESPSPANILFENNTVFDERNPAKTLSFKELIQRAYFDRINLGERGFYITPTIHFDRSKFKGSPFLYFTNGAALAEVTIDRFTGDLKVDRVDLLMDAGVPLTPGIDRGQVIGGFIQGMGWVTTEELKYSDSGNLLSYSPTTYKIPNVSDTPRTFNVAFFDNPDSTPSIKRSKALGEPPLLLGLAVWAAVKDALTSEAKSKNLTTAPLSLPATGEQILLRLTALKQNSLGKNPKAAQTIA